MTDKEEQEVNKWFRSKEGYLVKEHNHRLKVQRDGYQYDLCGEGVIEAVEEYFQAKRDKELGRWRDPEYPHIFVGPGGGGNPEWVGVVKDDEEGLAYGQFKRGAYPSLDPMSIVAYRYFAAHPAPKPWHDAKPGEVWVLTWGNELYNHPQPALVLNNGTFALRDSDSEIDSEKFTELDDPTIIDARRIYPEAE